MNKLSDIILNLDRAKDGDNKAVGNLIRMLEPVAKKKSYLNNLYDEDCFQELNSKILCCIHKFKFELDEKSFQKDIDNLKLSVNV